MSLKRKASFSGIVSPEVNRFAEPMAMDMDISPKHLNSRTRKRYRNDRPSDEVVYENTLRWLFTAQRQQQTPTPTLDEDLSTELPTPETIDPRQQTLLKFFRPKQSSFGQSPSGRWNQQSADIMPGNRNILQQQSLQVNLAGSSASSDPVSPGVQGADMDVEMDSGSDELAMDARNWAGGLGWM